MEKQQIKVSVAVNDSDTKHLFDNDLEQDRAQWME